MNDDQRFQVSWATSHPIRDFSLLVTSKALDTYLLGPEQNRENLSKERGDPLPFSLFSSFLGWLCSFSPFSEMSSHPPKGAMAPSKPSSLVTNWSLLWRNLDLTTICQTRMQLPGAQFHHLFILLNLLQLPSLIWKLLLSLLWIWQGGWRPTLVSTMGQVNKGKGAMSKSLLQDAKSTVERLSSVISRGDIESLKSIPSVALRKRLFYDLRKVFPYPLFLSLFLFLQFDLSHIFSI